jgi:hypothetical protein
MWYSLISHMLRGALLAIGLSLLAGAIVFADEPTCADCYEYSDERCAIWSGSECLEWYEQWSHSFPGATPCSGEVCALCGAGTGYNPCHSADQMGSCAEYHATCQGDNNLQLITSALQSGDREMLAEAIRNLPHYRVVLAQAGNASAIEVGSPCDDQKVILHAKIDRALALQLTEGVDSW